MSETTFDQLAEGDAFRFAGIDAWRTGEGVTAVKTRDASYRVHGKTGWDGVEFGIARGYPPFCKVTRLTAQAPQIKGGATMKPTDETAIRAALDGNLLADVLDVMSAYLRERAKRQQDRCAAGVAIIQAAKVHLLAVEIRHGQHGE